MPGEACCAPHLMAGRGAREPSARPARPRARWQHLRTAGRVLEAGDVATPTTGEMATQPPGRGRCAGEDGWVQRGPSMCREAAPRALCSPLGARLGGCSVSLLTAVWELPAAALASCGWANQGRPQEAGPVLGVAARGGGGVGCPPGGCGASTPGGDHDALPALCPRAAHPPQPITPGLGHTPLCLFPQKGGAKRKVIVPEGPRCGLRVWSQGGSRGAVAGRGHARPMPIPNRVPSWRPRPTWPSPCDADSGPRPRSLLARQTSHHHTCWLGPRPPHVPAHPHGDWRG